MNDQYEWLIETTADEGYPMEIVKGAFYYENGESESIPSSQHLSSGWFGDSGSMIVGEQYRPIPVEMEIEWLSYAEDKFYAGKFKLDYEKIVGLFRQKLNCAYIDNGHFSSFKISLAPGGQVFLYLQGANTILVGQFMASEKHIYDFKKEMLFPITVDITRDEFVKSNISDMPLQTQKEIAEKNINTQIWKDINQRYPWKLTWEVEGHSPKLSMDDKRKGVSFLSGEGMWCISGTNYLTENQPKPIPIQINGDFETPAGVNFSIDIYPGNVNGKELRYQKYEAYRKKEQELVKIFKEFYEKVGHTEFDIHLRISEDFKTGRVFLNKGTVEQEIPNVEVQISNNTFGK